MNFVKKQPQGDELAGYFTHQANIETINKLGEANSALKEALKELGGELSRVLEEKNHLYDRLVVTNDALGKLMKRIAASV